VVTVEAAGAPADAPIIVLQSHLDMVCQQRPGTNHDFAVDAIVPRLEGDKLLATGTTLGADNGLGVSVALALLTTPGLTHGPLELLFTVEEETGLFGAQFLDAGLVKGRLLINLDSEDPGEITIGCAGGAGTTLHLPLAREEPPGGFSSSLIEVSGLQGGHSGIQIAEPLGNALKLLSHILDGLPAAAGARLVSVEGGTAHNAVPREARALIAYEAGRIGVLEEKIAEVAAALQEKWRRDEPDLAISCVPAASHSMLDASSTEKALGLLRELPHGVWKMSERYPGKVETSANLAEVTTRPEELALHVSSRSFLARELAAAQQRVQELGQRYGAAIEVRDGYPGWEPRADSPLQKVAAAVFTRVDGKAPKVEVVHAGLECGILCEKLPGLDAISFGPLIRGPHTPEEWASVSSAAHTFEILTQLLAQLARDAKN
jgi:dipeptidase D